MIGSDIGITGFREPDWYKEKVVEDIVIKPEVSKAIKRMIIKMKEAGEI